MGGNGPFQGNGAVALVEGSGAANGRSRRQAAGGKTRHSRCGDKRQVCQVWDPNTAPREVSAVTPGRWNPSEVMWYFKTEPCESMSNNGGDQASHDHRCCPYYHNHRD